MSDTTNGQWNDLGDDYRYRVATKTKDTSPQPVWVEIGAFRYRRVPTTSPPPPSPPPPAHATFEDLTKRHQSQNPRLKYLRAVFQVDAEELGKQIAEIYTRFQSMGEFVAIDIKADELKLAFKAGLDTSFNKAGLESFPGEYSGENKHYLVKDNKPEEVIADRKKWYMTWEPGREGGTGRYDQNVIGSIVRNIHSAELPSLPNEKADLALNVYAPEIGITGWLSTVIEFPSEMALISYELRTGEFMWIGRVLDKDLNPPQGTEKAFWFFLEWIRPAEEAYYMYGVQLSIDFETASVSLMEQGFRKAKFVRKSKAAY